jgi:hypothetical protein
MISYYLRRRLLDPFIADQNKQLQIMHEATQFELHVYILAVIYFHIVYTTQPALGKTSTYVYRA